MNTKIGQLYEGETKILISTSFPNTAFTFLFISFLSLFTCVTVFKSMNASYRLVLVKPLSSSPRPTLFAIFREELPEAHRTLHTDDPISPSTAQDFYLCRWYNHHLTNANWIRMMLTREQGGVCISLWQFEETENLPSRCISVRPTNARRSICKHPK